MYLHLVSLSVLHFCHANTSGLPVVLICVVIRLISRIYDTALTSWDSGVCHDSFSTARGPLTLHPYNSSKVRTLSRPGVLLCKRKKSILYGSNLTQSLPSLSINHFHEHPFEGLVKMLYQPISLWVIWICADCKW